jgi:hypothetical protein
MTRIPTPLAVPPVQAAHTTLIGALASLNGFCNGPGFVKSSLHSRVIRSAGVVLLSGVGALAAT